MDINDLFEIDEDFDKLPQLSTKDYISKSKDLLLNIDNIYCKCWYNKRLTEDEYQQCDCDNCNGMCTIKVNWRDFNCYPNPDDGDCYIRCFDSEQFSKEIEESLFKEDSSYYELMSCEVTENKNDKWNNIPDKCEFNGKIYSILDIDLQGGFFTLYDSEAESGEIQVIDDVDMDLCTEITEDIIRKTFESEYGINPTTVQKLEFVNKFSDKMKCSKEYIKDIIFGKNNEY